MTLEREVKALPPLVLPIRKQIYGMFLKLATKSRTFLRIPLVFYAKLLSPHPASSAIRGVVQALAGVGEQGIALVLKVDEFAVGAVDTAWREAAGGVRRDIEATGGDDKNLTAHEKQVTEGAVGSVRAARRPGTAAVGGHLNGVVAWVDAEKFSFGEEASACLDDLWHSIMISF